MSGRAGAPLPDTLTFVQGAAIGVPYATAFYALFYRARARPGETVLVHGATGGVGLAAVQIAHAHGLIVFATGGSDEGRTLAAAQGADHVLDHHEAGYLDRIKQQAGGQGVNVILEMLANENLGKDLGLLAPGGRVVVIGSRGKVEIDPRDTMGRNGSILGMSLFNATEDELHSIHAALIAGFRDGVLRPVIARQFALSDAPRAHEAITGKGGAQGKIVLTP